MHGFHDSAQSRPLLSLVSLNDTMFPGVLGSDDPNGLKRDLSIMASEKKRRKLSSVDKKLKHPINPARPKDGDRRHRGSDSARLEQHRKQAAQNWNLDVGWTDAADPPQSQKDD